MKDELRWNKIFGAILATLLAIFGLRQVSEMIFVHKQPAKPGYAIAVKEEGAAGGEQADVPPDWGTVLPTADVAAGATVSTKCGSCHNFASGGPNQTGPNLYGVIGRKPGSHPGFAYSQAMTDFGGKTPVWDYAHLYQFLAGPQAYINGTKMSFVGLKKREDRINLIAWLRQQSASPAPIPAPNPAAAAGAKAPANAQGSAPAPNSSTTVAAKPGANGPAPVNGKAPPNNLDTNPSGVTPATGAVGQPDQLNPAPLGGSPK
jgi:cytochrome c